MRVLRLEQNETNDKLSQLPKSTIKIDLFADWLRMGQSELSQRAKRNWTLQVESWTASFWSEIAS